MRCLGYHAPASASASASGCGPGGASKLSHFVRVAQAAEAAKYEMVSRADGIGIGAKDEPPGSLCRSA